MMIQLSASDGTKGDGVKTMSRLIIRLLSLTVPAFLGSLILAEDEHGTHTLGACHEPQGFFIRPGRL